MLNLNAAMTTNNRPKAIFIRICSYSSMNISLQYAKVHQIKHNWKSLGAQLKQYTEQMLVD